MFMFMWLHGVILDWVHCEVDLMELVNLAVLIWMILEVVLVVLVALYQSYHVHRRTLVNLVVLALANLVVQAKSIGL